MYIHLSSNVFPLTVFFFFCCFSVRLFAMRDIFTNKYEYFLYMILGGFLQANGMDILVCLLNLQEYANKMLQHAIPTICLNIAINGCICFPDDANQQKNCTEINAKSIK